MNTQLVTFRQRIARQAVAYFSFSVALTLLSPLSFANDGCGSDGCTIGCGDGMLTGPTCGSIYDQTEPPLQDNSSDFIQQPTPGDDPSANTAPQNNSAPFNQSQAAANPSLFSGGVEGTLTAQGAGQGHAPGYINWAIPRSQFRMRFDAGFNNDRPDRAEYFYAQCGCGGGPGPGTNATPPTVNRSVDFQDLRGYLEIAASDRFSVFGEVPFRFIQTTAATNLGLQGTGDTAGFSDLEAGFKYALIRDADTVFTFQLKGYIPTGDASHGLGTNHVSLEPGFLAQQRINSRLDVFGELLDWIPIGGSSFGGKNYAGNILRYGVGAAYTVAESRNVKISPIVEFVGWSVLDGQVLNASGVGATVEDAATTIVNAKVGVRTLFKSNGSTLYLGYGHALTGQNWYEDFARVEYTIFL
jgi:hypothetical protein